MVAMTAWITGESADRAPLARPKPADAAAFPCATVALTALAPSMRLNARRFPPVSHTAMLSLTWSSPALAIAACTIRLASVSVSAISSPPELYGCGTSVEIGHHMRGKTAHRRQHGLWGQQAPGIKPADQFAELELLSEPGNTLDAVLRRADDGHVLSHLLEGQALQPG